MRYEKLNITTKLLDLLAGCQTASRPEHRAKMP